MINARALGSFTVTTPAIYYLIANAPEPVGDHGHGHDEGDHGEDKHGEKEESGDLAGASAEGTEETTEEQDGENADGPNESSEGTQENLENEGSKSEGDETSDGKSEDSGESLGHDTPDTEEDEEPKDTAREVDSSSEVEGVQFKGPTRHGEVGDTRKHIPDAKGGAKKRIESDYGMRQGVKEDGEPKPDGTPGVDPVRLSCVYALQPALLMDVSRQQRPRLPVPS